MDSVAEGDEQNDNMLSSVNTFVRFPIIDSFVFLFVYTFFVSFFYFYFRIFYWFTIVL